MARRKTRKRKVPYGPHNPDPKLRADTQKWIDKILREESPDKFRQLKYSLDGGEAGPTIHISYEDYLKYNGE